MKIRTTMNLKLSELEKTQTIKYFHDKDFFARDNEESFYWAGFIAADGCVLDNRKSLVLTIKLSDNDIAHLSLFKKYIKAENSITTTIVKNSLHNENYNDSRACEIRITSNKLCNDLKRFNITPRKTKIYTFPKFIETHPMLSHFMRGYFDGDGSLFYSYKPNKMKQLFFSLRGTSEFLEVFRKQLQDRKIVRVKNKPIRINNGIGILEYGGNVILYKICDFLYNGATVYLDRKYKIAKDHLNSYSIILEQKKQLKKDKENLRFRKNSLKCFKTYHTDLTKDHLLYLYNKYDGNVTKIRRLVHKRQSAIKELLLKYDILKN